MKIEKVTVIGMGAVGTVVAAKLHKNIGAKNLECLADGERLERYQKNGLILNGEKIDFNYVDSKDAQKSDLIIIATKNLQLPAAIKMAKTACGPDTMILSLLNGIQSERDLEEVFGAKNVLYSFVISLNSIHVGNKIDCTDDGILFFGEKDNSKTERTAALTELFDRCGIRSKNPEDIHLELWRKYLLNVTFNTLTAITRSSYGGFRFEVMQTLARLVGKEVIAVANAEGVPLTQEDLENDIKMQLHHDPHGKTSMLQDMEAGRKSENPWFCGTVVKLAKNHGIQVPYCDFLEKLVEGSEQVRSI